MNGAKLPVRKKYKWLAALLAFVFPGTGHMYLGLMFRGSAIMLLMLLNICAIVFVATDGYNALIIVMLSLLLPVIYFFNLFDALQCTDAVNERHIASAGWNGVPPEPGTYAPQPQVERGPFGLPKAGLLFIGAAGVAVIVLANANWDHWVRESSLSLTGGVILIGIGIGLWFRDRREHFGNKP